MIKTKKDKALAEVTRSKRNSPLIKAAGIGAALCLAFGAGFAANSSTPTVEPASASVVDSGFCVNSAGWEDQFKGSRSYKCAGNQVLKFVAPAATSCVINPGTMGLDPKITLKWSVPPGMGGKTAEFGMADGTGELVPLSAELQKKLTTTGSPEAFTSVLAAGKFPTVPGSRTLAVRFTDGKESGPWTKAVAEMNTGGLAGTCTLRG